MTYIRDQGSGPPSYPSPFPPMHTLGSDHGSRHAGQYGGFYLARASVLTCCLADRDTAFPPLSQSIDRRAFRTADGGLVDDTGSLFL